MHPDLLAASREIGRPLDDAWCSRLAAMHLIHLISTGEDIEKELVTPSLADVRRHANELRGTEQPVMQGR